MMKTIMAATYSSLGDGFPCVAPCESILKFCSALQQLNWQVRDKQLCWVLGDFEKGDGNLQLYTDPGFLKDVYTGLDYIFTAAYAEV
jgi:hypothetical protein